MISMESEKLIIHRVVTPIQLKTILQTYQNSTIDVKINRSLISISFILLKTVLM